MTTVDSDYESKVRQLRSRKYDVENLDDVETVKTILQSLTVSQGQAYVDRLAKEYDIVFEYLLPLQWRSALDRSRAGTSTGPLNYSNLVSSIRGKFVANLEQEKMALDYTNSDTYLSQSYKVLRECKRLFSSSQAYYNYTENTTERSMTSILSDLRDPPTKEIERNMSRLHNPPTLNEITLAKMENENTHTVFKPSRLSSNGRIFYNTIKLSVTEPCKLTISS